MEIYLRYDDHDSAIYGNIITFNQLAGIHPEFNQEYYYSDNYFENNNLKAKNQANTSISIFTIAILTFIFIGIKKILFKRKENNW
jgi:hypothetical protein